MKETLLILARHGATKSNLCRPYVLQGRGVDHELDSLGVAQAEALAHALADVPLRAIYASPLKRSLETASIVARRHEKTPTIVEELVEAHVGAWEGKSWDAISTDWARERALHDEDPSCHGYPGGENFCDVRERVVPIFTRLAHAHVGKTFLVVGHNVVNRVALAHWMGIPIRYARRIPQNNAGYNIVLFDDDRARVRSINLAGHLSGLIPPD